MKFSTLARMHAEQQAERHRYFLDLYQLNGQVVPADAFEHIDDEELYPSNRYFPITLYYDPKRLRTEAARQRLYRRTTRQHRGRIVRMRALLPDRLSRVSVSRGPRFEKLFLARGYATNVEGRTTIGRGKPGTFKVADRNFAAFRANAHLWAKILSDQSQAMFGVSSVGEQKALAAPMLGKRQKNGRPLPLVRHKGLFLGVRGPSDHDFHLAHATTPREAFDEGGRLPAQKFLFGNLRREPIEQLELEIANAQLIWGSRRRLSAETRSAASAAIVVWYSQIVATQRRISWDTDIRRKWPVEHSELLKEIKRHGTAIGVERLPAKAKARRLSQQIVWEADQIVGRIDDAWNDFAHRISRTDRILAALNGSAVDYAAKDIEKLIESKEYLVIIASWIGTLKRTGVQVFDESIARWLRFGWKSIRSNRCLFGQFPETTWLKLISLAGKYDFQPARTAGALPRLQLRGFSKPFTVTYEWVTIKTLEQPTACSWEHDVLALKGPMLCFPANKLAYWKQKASIVKKQNGFLAPGKGR